MKQNFPSSSSYNMNQQNNFQSQSPYMLNLNANPFMASKPTKKNMSQISPTPLSYHSQSNRIKEVYADNFIQEIKNISNCLLQYPYVGMDTEFPGVIYPCPVATEDFYYQYTKVNVDKLKLIQLGITLTNDKGEYPPYTCTWQFNLHFDIDKDQHSNDSITMLYNSGIDFSLMKNKGIPHSLFAEYLIVSGLVLNEKITWICFNGSSDFAYLLKYLINGYLPDDEISFINAVNLYFPNLYDIKHLVNDNETYKGGLNKLAKELDVERSGEIHQAGSDSQVTSDVFFRLVRNNVITSNDLTTGKNVIYGIGKGSDAQETINYTQFEQGVDISYLLQSINPAITYKTNIPIANNFQDKMFK
jgi:CCR4-NOT transcription complex subunit 7/8